jgi:hypothetical protein
MGATNLVNSAGYSAPQFGSVLGLWWRFAPPSLCKPEFVGTLLELRYSSYLKPGSKPKQVKG